MKRTLGTPAVYCRTVGVKGHQYAASVADDPTPSPSSETADLAPAPPPALADENIGAKIVSGGLWRLVAFAVATALGVVSTAIISREVGPESFALFTTGISLLTIAITMSDFGLLALGMREFAALQGAERDRSMRALITLRLAFSVLMSIGIIGFAFVESYPSDFVLGLSAAAIGLIALSVHFSYNVPLQASYHLNTIAVIEVTRQSLLVVGMAAVAVRTGDIGAVMAVYLPVAFLMAIVSGVLASRISPAMPSLDFAMMRSLLRHVGVFAIATSVGASYAYFAQVVINSILPADESGMFGLAFRVFAVMLGACMTAVSGAFPLLVTSSRSDLDRLSYATRRLVQTTALAGTACAVGLVTGASFVVAVVGGPEFSDAIPLVAIVGLALPASFVLITGGNVLLATGRHRELILVSVIGAIASIAITASLTSAFGMSGAAAGVVVGETAIALGYLTQLHRIDSRSLPALRWAIGVLAAGAVCCSAALLPWTGIVRATIGIAAFVGLAVLLRLIPPELIDRTKLVLRLGR